MDPPDLSGVVDEVLEAAWPRERRRAIVHLATSTLGRVGAFLLALFALSLMVRLVFGLVVPWTFFAFTGGLALVCAGLDLEERKALRRGTDDGPNHRPSTGCYPRTPLD